VLIENSPDFVMLQSSAFKVRGYISREQRPLLAKAIRVVNDGEAWLPRKLVAEMLDYFSTELAYKPAANLKLVNS
jgi:DNA-binding NarL/FixJ family response regulator